jgi:hypothetical protein
MGKLPYRELETTELFRLVLQHMELHSDSAKDPQAHAAIIFKLRHRLAELEMEAASQPARWSIGQILTRLGSLIRQ